MHIVGEPLFPHGVLRAGLLELFVPVCRQRVGNVRTEMLGNGRFVLVKPVLNTTIAWLNVARLFAANHVYSLQIASRELRVTCITYTVNIIMSKLVVRKKRIYI